MTQRTYANISDVALRQLQSRIACWAARDLRGHAHRMDRAYARAAIRCLQDSVRAEFPANRERAVLYAWEYFEAACAHLSRTES